MISSITQWVVKHRRLVIAFWAVLIFIGGAAAGPASKAMDQKFSVPGKEGWEANKEIEQRFHGTGGNSSPLVPLVTLKGGAAASRAQLAGLERRGARGLPGGGGPGHGAARGKGVPLERGQNAVRVAGPAPPPH